jgi:hypothetical protein
MLMNCSTHNMGVVAHIQDIAVARTQKGKKMGLRILEALVHAATEYGAYKVGTPLSIATHRNTMIRFRLLLLIHGLNVAGSCADAGGILTAGTTAHFQTPPVVTEAFIAQILPIYSYR